jgi:hypothetical protein
VAKQRKNKSSRTGMHTYKQNVRKRRKRSEDTRFDRFWFRIVEAVGWIILLGSFLMYWDSARLTAIIFKAQPVQQLTSETTGYVRLEGQAGGEAAYTDEGKLQDRYALLQKEPFRWGCGKGGCDYKLDDDGSHRLWGSSELNGVTIQAERFRFYKDWLPLNFATVKPEQLSLIYQGNSSRPLLMESPKGTAYGYYAVSPGDWVTVIGRANKGQLEAFILPGDDTKQPVLLIGTSVEQMLSEEKGVQTVYLIISCIVALMLLPKMIGRTRRITQWIKTRRAR